MSYYTTQEQFSFSDGDEFSGLIPDDGASIKVEFWNGNQWVEDSQSPVTKHVAIFTKNNVVRFTPAGGGYHIDEGNAL